jgi:hypothetical protein
LVDLRVVQVKNGRVEAVGLVNAVAGIIVLDDIGGRAVLASPAQAELITWGEVTTGGVNFTVIDDSELVRRDVLTCGDAVADIALFDSVLPSALKSDGGVDKESGGEDGGESLCREHPLRAQIDSSIGKESVEKRETGASLER